MTGRDYSTSVLSLSAVVTTGAGTAVDVSGMSSVVFGITGTFSATVTFQGSADGANWFSIQATNMTSAAVATTTTATGLYATMVAGLAYVRPNVTARVSGSITCIVFATVAAGNAALVDLTVSAQQDQNIAEVNSATPSAGFIDPVKFGALTNRSGTITLGGTAQTAIASNADRRYLLIQNSSDTDMWFNFTTAAVATQPSFKLVPGASFVMEGSFVSTEAISIIGATTGKIFTAKEG